jgi:hypothetical protein
MGAVGESVTSTGRPFDKGEPYVTYCFVPAALLDACCFARLNPDHRVALIIEDEPCKGELVFGDMLQLLDRSDDAAKAGWSSYGLRPKPEVRDYLIENGVDVGSDGEMKSHRTRTLDNSTGDILVPTPVRDIRWDVLRSLINDALLKLRIPEDKLVGP